jgi:hypothetical protein
VQIKPFGVLVRTDSKNRVTAINSSGFAEGSGWMQIDEGYGDKYHHAQSNYLPMPLTDERGVYRYKLVDGLVAQRTQAEMDADFDALPAPPLTTEERVNNVEQRTDALESANDDLILMMADLIGG